MKIITFLSILFTTIFYSQNKTDNYKYGFINENGKEITTLKYDKAYSFSEGIAIVCMNNKWGFINKNGKEITSIKYDTVYNCESGVSRIKINGKYGLIDRSGKEITEIKYDNIGHFDYDVACVKIDGKWGIINNKGIEITPLKYDYMQKTNAYSILCLKGKNKMTLIDENFLPIEANPLGYFSDNTSYFDESGIAKVCVDEKWGFINNTGEEISAIKYDYVFFFSEDMARVLLNNKWGFINESGNEVIPLIYDFMDEVFDYKSHCVHSLINRNYIKPIYLYRDKKTVEYNYSDYFIERKVYFKNGLLRIYAGNINRSNLKINDSKYIFLNKKGEEILSTKSDVEIDEYYNYEMFYHDGLRKVEKYENVWKYGFADTLRKIVIPLKYEYTYDFEDGVARVELKDKYGLIDKKGNNLSPLKYDYIEEFSEGLAMVEFKEKIGFIDKNGKEIIPPKYSNGDSFKEGFADVAYGGKVGFIDKTGKEITPFKYDRTESFKNGFARVKVKNKWGFINKTGKEITLLRYDAIEDFKENLAVVKMLVE